MIFHSYVNVSQAGYIPTDCLRVTKPSPGGKGSASVARALSSCSSVVERSAPSKAPRFSATCRGLGKSVGTPEAPSWHPHVGHIRRVENEFSDGLLVIESPKIHLNPPFFDWGFSNKPSIQTGQTGTLGPIGTSMFQFPLNWKFPPIFHPSHSTLFL